MLQLLTFPLAVPPPPSFPFNPEPTSAAVGQAPPVPLAGVATSSNTASMTSLSSGTRSCSSSSQRFSRRERRGWRLEASVWGPGHGSTELRPAASGSGHCGANLPLPVPLPAACPELRPQHSDDFAPPATNSSSGPTNPAGSQHPWAIDTTVSRPAGPVLPEPDEPMFNYCPIAGAQTHPD